ncbi:MAG: site-specific tyrosine recombinase XerD [Anaerolineae bacterium]
MAARQLPLIPTEDGSNPPLTRESALHEAIVPFQQYLRHQGKTKNTVVSFTSDLNLLMEFAGRDAPLKSLTTDRLNRYLEWMERERGVPCSQKTYARRVTTLKVFFEYLHIVEVLHANPAAALVQRSVSAPLQHVLTPDQIQAVLEETQRRRFAEKPDPRPDLLVRLLLDTGIKKGETMALTPADIDRSVTPPVVHIRHDSPRNKYRERDIPLDPEWPEVLDEYLAQYQPNEVIFDCTPRNLEYVLKDVGIAAGIEGFLLSFAVLRWTSALQDLRRGMEPDLLREKQGLSRVSWYETYAKLQALLAQQARMDLAPD